MHIDKLISKVKTNLNITDASRDLAIKDILQNVMDYCNLPKIPVEITAERQGITAEEAYALIDLPVELEPFVRKKLQGIINYEAENGTDTVFDVKSIKEGDTNITYNVDQNFSKDAVYGLSDVDKKALHRFRRVQS
ncbi:head-tail connector protein [Aminipila terrae]|uniref:DNA-packaging protein n=1 Tax=Aminipila terrae TaxID=2697030 RepID=A0A6P1MPI0_9FIRM|nr:DNA-packaging protein [Aminipila terrae]QHI72895.1 DNA-packaging protein [Aminipila terrae]